MQLLALLVSALSLATAVVSVPTDFAERATQTLQVSYDTVYDAKGTSLDVVACSDGENGLESQGKPFYCSRRLQWSVLTESGQASRHSVRCRSSRTSVVPKQSQVRVVENMSLDRTHSDCQSTDWNSPNCGSCWQLKYKNNTINVLAIDHAKSGFNIAKAALDKLTNNQAEKLGVIQATVTEVAPSVCGL